MYGPAYGWVYAIGAGDPVQFVKIGFTGKEPCKRLRTLQTASPLPLRLIAYWPGCYDMEGELHSVLDSFRAHGEWFRAVEYVLQTVRDMWRSGQRDLAGDV